MVPARRQLNDKRECILFSSPEQKGVAITVLL